MLDLLIRGGALLWVDYYFKLLACNPHKIFAPEALALGFTVVPVQAAVRITINKMLHY